MSAPSNLTPDNRPEPGNSSTALAMQTRQRSCKRSPQVVEASNLAEVQKELARATKAYPRETMLVLARWLESHGVNLPGVPPTPERHAGRPIGQEKVWRDALLKHWRLHVANDWVIVVAKKGRPSSSEMEGADGDSRSDTSSSVASQGEGHDHFQEPHSENVSTSEANRLKQAMMDDAVGSDPYLTRPVLPNDLPGHLYSHPGSSYFGEERWLGIQDFDAQMKAILEEKRRQDLEDDIDSFFEKQRRQDPGG